MSNLPLEIRTNFEAFSSSWKAELPIAISQLETHKEDFIQSYTQIASLNAWRNDLLEGSIPVESLEFFAEALNDALISHVFAQIGTWRSALISLRSCIENTLFCLFYKDHPIELKLWKSGKHKLGFTELIGYLERHPDIEILNGSNLTGIAQIKEEYSTLSRAVHASAKGFRMSGETTNVVLWKADSTKMSQWRTREKHTITGLNLLLTALFRERVSGTQKIGIRKSLTFAIPKSFHAKIKKELHVTIPTLEV